MRGANGREHFKGDTPMKDGYHKLFVVRKELLFSRNTFFKRGVINVSKKRCFRKGFFFVFQCCRFYSEIPRVYGNIRECYGRGGGGGGEGRRSGKTRFAAVVGEECAKLLTAKNLRR